MAGDNPTDGGESTNAASQEGSGEFSSAWKRFVQSLRQLLSGAPNERSLDPFLPLRNTVLDASERPDIVSDLQRTWSTLHSPNASPDNAHLLFMELTAFPAAVEIAEDEAKTSQDKPFKKKRLLSVAKTTLDSARDILANLPPTAKGVLKVLGEVVDLFRGD
jgi:hypothetical protein